MKNRHLCLQFRITPRSVTANITCWCVYLYLIMRIKWINVRFISQGQTKWIKTIKIVAIEVIWNVRMRKVRVMCEWVRQMPFCAGVPLQSRVATVQRVAAIGNSGAYYAYIKVLYNIQWRYITYRIIIMFSSCMARFHIAAQSARVELS